MAMSLPTLYKIKGKKVLEWDIEVNHCDDWSEYTISFGQQNGKKQSTSTAIRQGKNIGKANETTVREQCDLEAKALWQKQIDRKGYVLGINLGVDLLTGQVVGDNKLPSPMLAHEYEKHSKKLEFPFFVQPKLDGVRCLAYLRDGKVVLLSRQRKEFENLDHIRNDLLLTFTKHPKLVLDGELYVHGAAFEEIISAVKKPNALSPKLQFHVYDTIRPEKYLDRLDFLEKNVLVTNNIVLVKSGMIKSTEEIEYWHEYYTKHGYEGIMLRNLNGLYKEDGRSYDLLKYKKFITQEFRIVGAAKNKGKLENTCVFELDHNGTSFKAMPDGTQASREQLWTEWNNGSIKVGDIATIKFFAWTVGENPVPRFPIFVCLRNYE